MAEKIDELGAAFEAAKEETAGTYLHKFKKPFKWEGKEYKTLLFDFESLTGNDFIAVDREVTQKMGTTVIVAAVSAPFLMTMAARAAGVGSDMLEALPLYDFNKIISKARNFMLSADA